MEFATIIKRMSTEVTKLPTVAVWKVFKSINSTGEFEFPRTGDAVGTFLSMYVRTLMEQGFTPSLIIHLQEDVRIGPCTLPSYLKNFKKLYMPPST